MKANKNIRVYGTLMNHTLDVNKSDNNHNDALAYAYQLYDDRFGETVAVNNYQDIINKRLTAISYAEPGITTIENRDGSKGNPYMLIVKGNTNIGGNLYIDGKVYYKNPDTGQYEPLDLSDILNRLTALESMWFINSEGRVQTKNERSAVANGLYDASIN